MSALKFTETQTKYILKWKATEIRRGDLSIAVIPFGGRILSINYCHEEFLYTDANLSGTQFDYEGLSLEKIRSRKAQMGFKLWGGESTLVSPQSKWEHSAPPMALDSGHYKIHNKGNQIELSSGICQETGLQILREITILSEHSVELIQSLVNHSDKNVEFGIWNMNQILRNSYFYIPLSIASIKNLTNPIKKESHIGDDPISTVLSPIKEHWTRLRADEPLSFNVGGMLPIHKGYLITGKLSQLKNNFLIMERHFSVYENAKYMRQTVFEIHNSPNLPYALLQIHSPIQTIPPHQKITHKQIWKFRQIDKEEGKYIIF